MNIDDKNLEMVYKAFRTVYSEALDGTESHRDTLAMTVTSNATEEQYGWFGQFPALREWVGDRQIKKLTSHGFAIRNKKFESTVSVQRDDISDDKVGLYKPMFQEMGRVTKQHPDKMIFELLNNGFATECYDGQNFFDADHPHFGSDMVPSSMSNMQDGSGEPWFLLDLSRAVKPIIWQEREQYAFQTLDNPNNTNVFMSDEYFYGIRARVNCGFGLWQLAFGSKAELNSANLRAAYNAMAEFAGDKGHKLGIAPTHIVVGANNYFKARDILLTANIGGSTNTDFDLVKIIKSSV
ncbi:MAG: hypothetical protein DI589_02070 [Shinella sp.]|nr:MAG: hypothetical protein DI589_02070 [Shinella sp.]